MKTLLLLVMLALGACSNDGDPPHKVDYYKSHDVERAQKLTQCRNDPGRLVVASNCTNAQAAENAIVFSSQNSKIPSF